LFDVTLEELLKNVVNRMKKQMIQIIRKILVVFARTISLIASLYRIIYKQMMLSFYFLSNAVLVGLLLRER